MKKDIFDLLKDIAEKDQAIAELFGESYLDREISIIWDMIEDMLKIKEKNKDFTGDLFTAFECGEITKKQLISKLKKLA